MLAVSLHSLSRHGTQAWARDRAESAAVEAGRTSDVRWPKVDILGAFLILNGIALGFDVIGQCRFDPWGGVAQLAISIAFLVGGSALIWRSRRAA
jgi:hypothetical protein